MPQIAPQCTHMRSGIKFGDMSVIDVMLKNGLVDAFHNYHMGITGSKEVSVDEFPKAGCTDQLLIAHDLFLLEMIQLEKAGLTTDNVDLFELNKAFAAQSAVVVKELGCDQTKVNIIGGEIALGHPIGTSGAKILVTRVHALERTGKKKGVAALCVGEIWESLCLLKCFDLK